VRYREEVKAGIRALRVGGYLAIALGIGQSIWAYVVDEPVNAAGIVPGVAIGFGLISVGAYALIAAGYLRAGTYWWLALPATLASLVVWSMAMLVLNEVAVGSVMAFGRGLVGLVVVFGYFATLFTVGWLLGILPCLFVLAWIADRIPWLRNAGAGEALRGRALPRKMESLSDRQPEADR
jgi:hypothetical protein